MARGKGAYNKFNIKIKLMYVSFSPFRNMDLRGNRITTFRPNAFHNMENLLEIHIISNKMIRLPTNSFYNYPKLKVLDIW